MTPDAITYVLEQLGADSVKRSGQHLMCNCPLSMFDGTVHGSPDKSRKLGVLVQEGMAPLHCFYPGCTDEISTLYKLTSVVGAKLVAQGQMTLEELGNLKAFVQLEEEETEGLDAFKARPVALIPERVSNLVGTGSPYWLSRGVSPETAQARQLGEGGGRALMPYYDRSGALVAIQGRLLPGLDADDDGNDARFKTWPTGFLKQAHLFGEHLATRPSDFIVVVESPFDAIMLQQWLHPDVLPYGEDTVNPMVVATMGAETGGAQMDLLVSMLSLRGELALGYDADNAGTLSTRKMVDALKARVAYMSIIPWEGKDATDAGEPPMALDRVQARALQALGRREDWLQQTLKRTMKAG